MKGKKTAAAGLGIVLLLGACGDEPPEPEVQIPGPDTNITDEEGEAGEEDETDGSEAD